MSNGPLAKFLRNAQDLPFIFRTTGVTFSTFFVFPINPELFTLTLPTRGGVIQTMNSNFENWFGAGIPKGTLRGTFGFMPTSQFGLGGIPLPGQLHHRLLEGIATNFYNEAQQAVRDNQATWQFMDLTDAHFLKIRLIHFQYERATQHQFLHRYTIEFVVLEDYLNHPKVFIDSLLNDLSSPVRIFNRIISGFGNFPGMPESLITGVQDKATSLYESFFGPEKIVP